MSRPSALHVNLPDVKRKPLLPGPNSWAQDAQKPNVMKGNNSGVATKGVATNRSKYEVSHLGGLPLSYTLVGSKTDQLKLFMRAAQRNRLVLQLVYNREREC